MTAADFERRLVQWAKSQRDIEALIQIGSRVQVGGQPDQWSDWDYHLISSQSSRYRGGLWLKAIASVWGVHHEKTPRGVIKLSAIFEGGHEVDFVPIPAWQMKLVYWAMKRPGLAPFYPGFLRRGIANTRMVVRPGYRVVVGGPSWERRLSALEVSWPSTSLSPEVFTSHVAGFWRHAVWVSKKIARGESRAALRWSHVELMEHVWALLTEEARLAGRPARPEARKAEQWLDARRLAQTTVAAGVDTESQARALLSTIDLFEELSTSVARAGSFELKDYTAVAAWLRTELAKILGRP